MDKLAMIVPTKNRPDRLREAYDSFELNKSSKKISEFYAVIDYNESHIYDFVDFPVLVDNNFNLVKKLNYTADLIIGYKYLAFIGDDVVIKTKNFDEIIINTFEENPHIHIIYCNDLLNGASIANHWVIRTSKVKEIGFFALPGCNHMFIDNFWTKVGQETGSIMYLENVIWEHNHYLKDRRKFDDTYKKSNNQGTFEHDNQAFHEFISSKEYKKVINILKKKA